MPHLYSNSHQSPSLSKKRCQTRVEIVQHSDLTRLCEATEDKQALKPEGIDTGASYLWKTSTILGFHNEFCLAFCPRDLGKLSYY